MLTIIAEPGCIAEGRLIEMHGLIEDASAAGCDAIKFQWTSDAASMVARRRAPAYDAAYRWLQFPLRWHGHLAEHARELGMSYGCSVYLPRDVAALVPLVDFLKVSAFEAEDDALVVSCIGAGVPVYVSLGMGARAFTARPRTVQYLHCTSAYPAPVETLDLSRIRRENLHGLSDHSAPSDTSVGGLAVAAGAQVLETHMRHWHAHTDNPDFAVARTPEQLAEYVAFARFAETCLSRNAAAVDAAEAPMRAFKVRS